MFLIRVSGLDGVSNAEGAISYPEPSDFLRRMLDEKEGLWKGPVLNSGLIVLYYISDNQSGSQKIGPFQSLRFRRACAVRS